MSLVKEVVRISDRFFDHSSPDCIDRQERLPSCIGLVCIFYLMLSMGLVTMSAVEKRMPHRRIIDNVNIELMIEPKKKHIPQPLIPMRSDLQRGKVTGGTESPVRHDPAIDPTSAPKQEERIDSEIKIEHRRLLPVDAPVSTVSTNDIKTKPEDIAAKKPVTEDTATSHQLQTTAVEEQAGGKDTHETGVGVSGTSPSTGIGSGLDDDISGGEKIATSLGSQLSRVQWNVVPYRNRLLRNFAEHWKPTKKREIVIVALVISKDGQLIDREIIQSAGRKADRNVLSVLDSLQFEPLPDFFKGESLTFKITLDAQMQN